MTIPRKNLEINPIQKYFSVMRKVKSQKIVPNTAIKNVTNILQKYRNKNPVMNGPKMAASDVNELKNVF